MSLRDPRTTARTWIRRPLLVAACLVAGSVPTFTARAQQACPNPPVVNVGSPTVPADVCIPAGFGDVPIAFFDDFSWKSFVAMVWPARKDDRGAPDPTKTPSDPGTRVFETFKADWEVFRPGGGAPSAWNVFEQGNPCGAGPIGVDDLVLASFSKFGNLGQAGFGDLVHALPAQNSTWVRYATGYDRAEYEQILNGQLYLRANLDKAPLTFSNGATDVKSAWIDMTNVPHPERYYTRSALVQDPVTNACSQKTVGLVGLHIVQKTPSRPQWIWSSFEQVDNVPPSPGKNSWTFNDGSGSPMPLADPNKTFPPTDWANPKLYNVIRVKPIDKSTEQTNVAYQAALGGVWQFYKLVVTQWPLQLTPPSPIPPSQSGLPKFTFPGLNFDKTSFANTALETWEQNRVTTGCMACHTQTQKETDFVWGLEIHAFPLATQQLLGARGPRLPAPLERLRAVLRQARSVPKDK